MSYVKTAWADGDTVSAEKLNKIETALAIDNDCVYNVELHMDVSDGSAYLDKTYREIKNAAESKIVILTFEEQEGYTTAPLDGMQESVLPIHYSVRFDELAFESDDQDGVMTIVKVT